MRMLASRSFWVLVVVGGGLWLYDVIYYLRNADDLSAAWPTLILPAASGVALESLFLIVLRRFIHGPIVRTMDGQAVTPSLEEEMVARVDLFAYRLAKWMGAILLSAMVLLMVGAYVLGWFHRLAPTSFVVGFTITWLVAGGHRYSPPRNIDRRGWRLS